MTFRRTLLIGLLPALSIGFYTGHVFSGPDRTPAPIEVYEDGSARMSDGSSAPEGTYSWDCRTMGNRICGVDDPTPAELHWDNN